LDVRCSMFDVRRSSFKSSLRPRVTLGEGERAVNKKEMRKVEQWSIGAMEYWCRVGCAHLWQTESAIFGGHSPPYDKEFSQR
jgi:hypothetical protein